MFITKPAASDKIAGFGRLANSLIGSIAKAHFPSGIVGAVTCLAAIVFAVSATPTHAATHAPEIKPDTPAKMFSADFVRLLDTGVFAPAVKANREYLLALDCDRLLAPFLREAGLAPRKPAYGNWESGGLDGHTAGHYLSALAFMIASGNDTSDGELRRRLDYMLDELDRAQQANGNGYLGGVPGSAEFWKKVGAGDIALVWKKWVPWYNIHKTYTGLRDAYLVGGEQKARDMLVRVGDWCATLTSQLSDAQMQQMIAQEFGGMNEVLADIYAITGDKKYLRAAERFNHKAILDPLVQRKDQLTGKHANTQIPKVIGFERIATLTGDKRLDTAARFFWETVTQKRSIAIGGNSVREHFNDPKNFRVMIEDREGPETCNTYNMLRLTEQLFASEPRAAYADYYERALFNHLLSAIHTEHPGYVYFTPIRPNHYRVYSEPDSCFWCCVGTGMENPGRYGDFIYQRANDGGVYVNLFIASELQISDGAVLRQETRFPYEASTRLSLKLNTPASFTLRLRHPAWVGAGEFNVKVNGRTVAVASTPSSYAELRREWRDGDIIEVALPMRTTVERLPDGSDWVAILHGPIVLAAPDGTENLTGLRADGSRMGHIAHGPLVPLDQVPVLLTTAEKLPAHIKPDVAAGPLHFRLKNVASPAAPDGIPLIPFFTLHDARYQMYWELSTPEKLAERREKLAAAERANAARAAATLDSVAVGEQQPEVEHDFKGEETKTGANQSRRWRDGKWFQYTLDTRGHKSVDLEITCWGGDSGRAFDIFANDTLISTVELKNEKPGQFFEKRFAIPAAVISNARDGRITTKFVAKPSSLAGGIYDVRFMKATQTNVAANLLWYDKPAEKWEEALPIANGRIAAMVFGQPVNERLQLNECTLWAGGPYNPVNPDAKDALPEARRLINEGSYKDAAKLVNDKIIAKPRGQMPYQTVGDLLLTFPAGNTANYRRDLNLDTATTTVSYTQGGVNYTREIFANAPANVIVVRLTADQPGKLSFTAGMHTPMRGATVSTESGNTIVMRGKGGDSGGVSGIIQYQARSQVIATGGKVAASKDSIAVSNADSVTLLIAVATSYKNYNDASGNPEAIVKKLLASASKKSVTQLRDAHLKDYQPLFRRVSIDLGQTDAMKLPTDARIAPFAEGNDPQLLALYYQYGRYLLLGSSRPGGQPANLQGIWNDQLNPPWQSKYTININTEMNYWPAESGNLGECVEPLIAMLEDLTKTGARTAREMYGARGWVVHHNTDLWRASAPIDGATWGMWPTGGAWLCLHLWERYEFSGDKKILQRIYPVLKGAAEFFNDTLQQDPTGQWLVTNPSISPELVHPKGESVCAGPTMDMQILRDLFANTIKAAEMLGIDADFRKQLAATRARLAPNTIGSAGQLQEWMEDWDMQNREIHHRHVSHLYGLFPGRDITLRGTPELAAAVRKSLDIRGDKSTGWATAWRICLWTHLGDGDRAYEILKLLISPGLTYPNMFDAHPPFQIDGNFGGAAGVVEMVMQSRADEIEFLPALPKALSVGSVKGLRARGGFEVDVTWKDGKLVEAVVTSLNGNPIRLRCGAVTHDLKLAEGKTFRWSGCPVEARAQCASAITAQDKTPDKNFYVFLCLGQSNMEGFPGIEEQDKGPVDARFQMLAAVDFPEQNRTKGQWYPATPPLSRPSAGIGPSDYFGRTLAAQLPREIKVGIVNVSIGGCKIELFNKVTYQSYAATAPDWMAGIIKAYDGNPYQRLVELAKLAQRDGTIKGILLHQGESNTNDKDWPAKVKAVYANLLADLNLNADDVPLIAGEVVGADQQGKCASMNKIIDELPKTIPTAHIVSSAGCASLDDHLHFSPAGYRELGKRYAQTMLPLLETKK